MLDRYLAAAKRIATRALPVRGLGVTTGGVATVSGILPALGGVCPFCLVGMPWCPICALGALPVVGGLAASAVGFLGLDSLAGRDGADCCGTDACTCHE